MLHQLPLPTKLHYLFPLASLAFQKLPEPLQLQISSQLGFIPEPSDLVRPFQTTISMGWSWAVAIAQCIASNILNQARKLCLPFANASLNHLNGTYVNLHNGDSIVDSYIDDVFCLCAGWPSIYVIQLYRTIAKLFNDYGLPRHPQKSSPLTQPVTGTMTFLGWEINITKRLIYPNPRKSSALAQDITTRSPSCISTISLLTLLGKAIWLSLARRPLLSTLDTIFRHRQTTDIESPANLQNAEWQELIDLTNLPPLAQVNLRLPWSHFVLATDASLQGGAVVYTLTSATTAMRIYDAILKASPNGNMPPSVSNPLGSAYYDMLSAFSKRSKWVVAYSHRWKREEHIAKLEASILTSALQWAISRNITSHQLLLLTDSSASLGALSKGRCSL